MSDEPIVSLSFALEIEDDWPPVGAECLPFRSTATGYLALVAPLFVKGLSVGDVIEAEVDPVSEQIFSWRHVTRSAHSTIWIARLRQTKTIAAVLAELEDLGCSTVSVDQIGVHAVDVPENVAIDRVDAVLERLDPDSAAVAFPSMRHPD
jgi:hypothetical protein